MQNFWALFLLLSIMATGCGGDNLCAADQVECVFERQFPDVELKAGEESDGMCQSWTLHNPTELWFTSVEFANDGAYHHSNWFFVPDTDKVYPRADGAKIPDGIWDCDTTPASPFTELQAAITGGFLFAQSTQSRQESQNFAAGGAVRIPPYSKIIGSTHLLNASDRKITTSSHMRIKTIPPSEVQAKLAPARIEYHDLRIQPNAQSTFTVECNIQDVYQETFDRAIVQYPIYYVLPHYHDLGMWTELQLAGGPRDGEVIFRNDGAPGEVFGKTFDPPFDIIAAGANGLRLTCGFQSDRTEVVGWGIGDQEMCVLAIFADSDIAYQGDVPRNKGRAIEVTAEGVHRYGGDCTLWALPWDHQKEGGEP